MKHFIVLTPLSPRVLIIGNLSYQEPEFEVIYIFVSYVI